MSVTALKVDLAIHLDGLGVFSGRWKSRLNWSTILKDSPHIYNREMPGRDKQWESHGILMRITWISCGSPPSYKENNRKEVETW